MSQTPPPGEAAGERRRRRADDAQDDDWEWRRRIRANPTTAEVYRIGVFIVGLVVVVVGSAAHPVPRARGGSSSSAASRSGRPSSRGPSASSSSSRSNLRVWEEWVKRQNPLVKGLVGIVGIAFIATVLWLTFHFSGIPGFFPDGLENWMRTTARI